jgi:Ser/Thr protein kinase RdoA (MazF antagonist)
MDITSADLARDFGVRADALRPHTGGYESDCWVADDAWFVKLWKQQSQPQGLGVLQDLQDLGLLVPAPIPAVSGELYAVLNDRAYAVFPYIQGRTANQDDWRVTARALRQVHELGDRPRLPHLTWDEPEIRALGERLDHPWIADRRDEVAAAIHRLDETIKRCRLAAHRMRPWV